MAFSLLLGNGSWVFCQGRLRVQSKVGVIGKEVPLAWNSANIVIPAGLP